MSELHVRIVTPQGIYKEFDTPIINIQTEDGNQGVLPNHMPLVTMLRIVFVKHMQLQVDYSISEIMLLKY